MEALLRKVPTYLNYLRLESDILRCGIFTTLTLFRNLNFKCRSICSCLQSCSNFIYVIRALLLLLDRISL